MNRIRRATPYLFLALFLYVSVHAIQTVQAALFAPPENVTLKATGGKTVGKIQGGRVYDDSNAYVGRVDSNGVYDDTNKKIADSPELVGWLIERP